MSTLGNEACGSAVGMTRRERICTAILMALLFVLFPMMKWLTPGTPDMLMRSLSGLLLGSVAALGYAVVKDLVHAGHCLGWKHVWFKGDPGLLPWPLYPLILVLSGLIWLIGWEEQHTDWAY